MKITKTANNKKRITISKKEWQSIGKTAGWMKDLFVGKEPTESLDNAPAGFNEEKQQDVLNEIKDQAIDKLQWVNRTFKNQHEGIEKNLNQGDFMPVTGTRWENHSHNIHEAIQKISNASSEEEIEKKLDSIGFSDLLSQAKLLEMQNQ